jgi:hypothetical protein
MPALTPIYTAENCHAAYQLNWSLSLFWRQRIDDDSWLAEFRSVVEPGGIRVLQHHLPSSYG